jgi:chromosome segregation ATPase
MFGTIKAVLILTMLAGAGGLYTYVTNLQKTAEIHRLNAEKLEVAVAQNEEALRVQKENYEALQKNLEEVNEEFQAARAQNSVLTTKLAEHDLNALAAERPDSITRLVNRGTKNAGRCFEILSGAPLNDKEKEAKSAKSFNNECPWLWPGPTTAQ